MVNKITRLILIAFTVFTAITLRADDNLNRGIAAIKAGDYVKALDILKSVSKDSYEANLYYGIALFKTGSLADAEKSLKAAIRNDEERPEAYSSLGEIYTQQKKYSDAAAQFELSKKYLPLSKTKDQLEKEEIELIITVLKAESENFIADGKVDKAISSLTQAKIFDDKNPVIYVGLGDAYLARGAFDVARNNYDQSLKLKPNYAPALFGLGDISFKKKKYSDALDYYIKSSNEDNNFAPAFFMKGMMFYLIDKFNDAIDAFERYDKLVPGSLKGKTYMAKAHYGKQEFDIALKILEEVLSIDPTYSEANKYKAYILIEQKKYDEAEQYFNKVKPEDLNAEDYTKWSKIFTDKKEFAKAYQLLDKAVSLDSNDENTYFEYAKAMFADTKYAEANTLFLKSIELGNINLGAYVFSGVCYYYTKEFEKGIEILNKCIEKDPAIKSAWLWRANNYINLNKNAEACNDYKKYLEFEPNDQFALDQVSKICEK
jgi:tetratricopeptide (TPR) repeat protein